MPAFHLQFPQQYHVHFRITSTSVGTSNYLVRIGRLFLDSPLQVPGILIRPRFPQFFAVIILLEGTSWRSHAVWQLSCLLVVYCRYPLPQCVHTKLNHHLVILLTNDLKVSRNSSVRHCCALFNTVKVSDRCSSCTLCLGLYAFLFSPRIENTAKQFVCCFLRFRGPSGAFDFFTLHDIRHEPVTQRPKGPATLRTNSDLRAGQTRATVAIPIITKTRLRQTRNLAHEKAWSQ